jgi:predicted aspartyl protease
VIQQDPHSESAYRAHDILGNLYQRNGLYKEALRELDAALLERPNAQDMRNVRPVFALLAASGDMRTIKLRPSKLALTPGDDVPFTINGHSDSFAFDTGATISVISEGEAAHLGLVAKAVSTKFGNSSGNGLSGVRVAVAAEMRVGGLTLRNIPFMVIPDTSEPFAEMPPDEGHRGLIGLPILLAMRSIRWTLRSTLEFDLPETSSAPFSNFLFHDQSPIVQVKVSGHDLDFTLDTGAVDTDLNPRFAREFPELVAEGKKETNKITGIGGSKDYIAVLLPPFALDIGGKTVMLPHAHVSTEEGLGGTTIWAGNLGDDALTQSHAIVLDFKRMFLLLE